MSQEPVPNPANPVPQPSGTGVALMQSAAMVIELAMRNAGKLDKVDRPDSEDLRLYMVRLNGLVNFEQTQGLKLWLQEDVSFTPVEGQQSYVWSPTGDITLPKPTRIIEGYFTFPTPDTGGIYVRYPLQQLSRQEFDLLGVLNTAGITNSFFVDKQQNYLVVWLWLNPDAFTATASVHFITQTQVNQAISITDSMNFPVEWFQWMQWALADEISQGQPIAVQQKCAMMRAYYHQELMGFDVEDTSTFLQPDMRRQNMSGKFA